MSAIPQHNWRWPIRCARARSARSRWPTSTRLSVKCSQARASGSTWPATWSNSETRAARSTSWQNTCAARNFDESAIMDSTENARMLAIGYLDARNYQRAEEVLRSALTQNPQDVMLLTEMARTKFLMGDHGAAERFALQALALEPENGYPMRIYAATLGALGRRKEALS